MRSIVPNVKNGGQRIKSSGIPPEVTVHSIVGVKPAITNGEMNGDEEKGGLLVAHYKELDVFKGYTVDPRLKEFRKLIFGKTFEIFSFDSPTGRKMLAEYEKKGGSRESNLC